VKSRRSVAKTDPTWKVFFLELSLFFSASFGTWPNTQKKH